MADLFVNYAKAVSSILGGYKWAAVEKLASTILECWKQERQLFLCGNGGSAGNAVHLANDFLYGVTSHVDQPGIKAEALSANIAVVTCLANDVGYGEIFSEQLRVKAQPRDVLLVLSGSGNSENVVQALKVGNDLRMSTFAILGYTGGLCREIAQEAIHFPIDDMQIAEDLQLIVGHMCMQYLHDNIKTK